MSANGKHRVLIVEDDPAIRRGIADALRFDGYDTFEACDGDEGMRSCRQVECDLVLLDLVLPGHGGLEILREIRAAKPQLPVIILTAMGDEKDRVAGLRLGADDYVVKPFSVTELLARVHAVLRRTPERPSDVHEIVFSGGRVDVNRREVCFDDGQRADLTDREVLLLRYLASNCGRVVRREEMIMRVWGLSPKGLSTRMIDMQVTRLRNKLRDGDGTRRIIRTVRGTGYVFGEIGVQT